MGSVPTYSDTFRRAFAVAEDVNSYTVYIFANAVKIWSTIIIL